MGSVDINTLVYILDHTGADKDEMFKSLGIDLEKGGRDTSKLVQVERTVTSSKGTSFTRKYWVSPDAVRDTDRVIGGQANLDGAKGSSRKPSSTRKPEGAYGSSRIGELSTISLTTSSGIPLSLDSVAFKHNGSYKAAEKAVRECIQNSKATGHDLASALNRSKLGFDRWKVKSEDRAKGVIKLSVEDGMGNVEILTVQLNQRNTEKDAAGVKADTETLKHIKLGDKIWVNDNGKWSRGTKRAYSNAAPGFEVSGRRLDPSQVSGMGWSKDKPGAGTHGDTHKDKPKDKPKDKTKDKTNHKTNHITKEQIGLGRMSDESAAKYLKLMNGVIDAGINLKVQGSGQPGFGKATINGDAVGFGYDNKGSYLQWSGRKLRTVDEVTKVFGSNKGTGKGSSKQHASTQTKGSSSAQSFFDNRGKRDAAANKAAIQSLIKGGASRDSLMEMAEKNGVTWKKHDNPGINWMRASMAMTGATTRGTKSK